MTVEGEPTGTTQGALPQNQRTEPFQEVPSTEETRTRKPNRSRRRAIPKTNFGKLLVRYRAGERYSLRQMARKVGISHPYLGAIELGKRHPTLQIIERICRVLHLSHMDAEILKYSWEHPSSQIPGPYGITSAQELLEATANPAVREVWVAAERPPELQNRGMLEIVRNNILILQKRYRYFIDSRLLWEELCEALQAVEQKGTPLLMGVLLPRRFRDFVLNPPRILSIGETTHGAFFFPSPRSNRIELGFPMDDASAQLFRKRLRSIIEDTLQHSPVSIFRASPRSVSSPLLTDDRPPQTQ